MSVIEFPKDRVKRTSWWKQFLEIIFNLASNRQVTVCPHFQTILLCFYFIVHHITSWWKYYCDCPKTETLSFWWLLSISKLSILPILSTEPPCYLSTEEPPCKKNNNNNNNRGRHTVVAVGEKQAFYSWIDSDRISNFTNLSDFQSNFLNIWVPNSCRSRIKTM